MSYLDHYTPSDDKADCAGRDFAESLKDKFPEEQIPIVIAAILDERADGEAGIDCKDIGTGIIDDIFAYYVALRLRRIAKSYIPRIDVELQCLEGKGITSRNKIRCGGDNYIYRLPSSQYWRYALMLETQNRSFLVLMRYGSDASASLDQIGKDFAEHQNDPRLLEMLKRSYAPQLWILHILFEIRRGTQFLEQYVERDIEDNCPYTVGIFRNSKVEEGIYNYQLLSWFSSSLASAFDCLFYP